MHVSHKSPSDVATVRGVTTHHNLMGPVSPSLYCVDKVAPIDDVVNHGSTRSSVEIEYDLAWSRSIIIRLCAPEIYLRRTSH